MDWRALKQGATTFQAADCGRVQRRPLLPHCARRRRGLRARRIAAARRRCARCSATRGLSGRGIDPARLLLLPARVVLHDLLLALLLLPLLLLLSPVLALLALVLQLRRCLSQSRRGHRAEHGRDKTPHGRSSEALHRFPLAIVRKSQFGRSRPAAAGTGFSRPSVLHRPDRSKRLRRANAGVNTRGATRLLQSAKSAPRGASARSFLDLATRTAPISDVSATCVPHTAAGRRRAPAAAARGRSRSAD